MIHVITAGLVQTAHLSCLNAEEIRRASTFKFPDDSARWKAFRAGLRHLLSASLGITPQDVPLVLGEFGKPELAPPFNHLHFNLSHCGDTALVALCSEGPVGIDFEALDRAPSLLGCEPTFCHPDEIISLPIEENARANWLLEIWTAKEAVLKAIGTGFSQPPEQVKLVCCGGRFTVSAETPLERAEDIHIVRIHPRGMDDFLVAIAVPSSVVKITGPGNADVPVC